MEPKLASALPTVPGSAPPRNRLRMLCLHSFRTSAKIFQQQFKRSGLDKEISDLVLLDFIDAPHVASGPAPRDVQRFFEPPYYEWANAVREDDEGLLWTYHGAEVSEQYVINHMIANGPYDGIIGFSQGALLSSALLALQQAGKGEAQGMPDVKLCICIGAAKSRSKRHIDAFASIGNNIRCRSCHILGEKDQLYPYGMELVQAFHNPVVITHQRGHIVPPLGGAQFEQLRSFLEAAASQPAL